MKKRIISALLASVMVLGTLTACGKTETPAPGAENTGGEQTATESANEGSETPMVVGYLPFSEKFSPFFAETAYDRDVAERMTQINLLTQDRMAGVIYKAIEGETVPFNGTDYTYTGPADLEIVRDEAADTTTYNWKLREDLTFSDGEPITADDLIFTLYTYMDKSYDGSAVLYSKPVVGLKNYRANSTAADTVTTEDVQKALKEMPEALVAQISEAIIAPTLEAEKTWCEENFEANGAASAEEFFVSAYATDETYKAEGKDYDTIVADVIKMYGSDYKTLGTNYAGDEANFDADAAQIAEAYVVDQLKASGEGEEVANIEGIKKLGDYEISVTTNGFDASMVYSFDFAIAPLHYYGDKAQYDYENNKFGFPREDLTIVKDKTVTPLGAGPYKFSKFENKIVYFEANDSFYKGAPKTKYVQFKESTDQDKIPGVEQGTIDISDPTGSKAKFEQIGTLNGNGEITGEKIITNTVDNQGYGYIGLNAKTMNVGGEPASDASKNLRKAIATVMSVYRDVSIDSYYGDAASVVNYPISNTSWAAPQKSDADYKLSYSVDVEGNDIYTDSMSAEEKFEAALNASLAYFEAAGYTVADGKLTAAPAGAKLSYEIIIGADGAGDHPSFAILTDAKAAFEKIGFTLEINDPTDSNILWDALNAKSQEMWAAAWQSTPDPDMYQIYHSESINSNHYCINDEELDTNIIDARSSDDQTYRKSVYKQCMDTIMDWAVELPVYQRQNCIVYSPERVDAETFTKDITTYYEWTKEIYNVAMK